MLPVYEAIDIVQVISQQSGHTRPWVVLANTPTGLQSFVVKLYTTAQIQQYNSVTSEVICNALASEFDLNIPKAAFIDIPDALLINKSPEWQQLYNNADIRLKFATAQLSDVTSAIPSLSKTYYSKRISLDTLYAFDNLIRNGDRGQQKTNLLVGKKAWLIDHEFALQAHDITNTNWANFTIEEKFTKYHLLHSYLKHSIKNKKQNYFNEFIEYVHTMNINKLNSYYTQLTNEGFQVNKNLINTWLHQVKQNSAIFVNSLKESLE